MTTELIHLNVPAPVELPVVVDPDDYADTIAQKVLEIMLANTNIKPITTTTTTTTE